MNFVVQLPYWHQLIIVITWLKLILNSCLPTAKTNTHSYSNNILNTGIRDKAEKLKYVSVNQIW